MISKATMMLTGAGPPVYKQLKTAMTEGNEDKAIALYMSKDGSKLHPSKPFPTKKVPGSDDTPMHVASRHALGRIFKMFLEYGGHPGCLNARKENCGHTTCQLTSFQTKRADILDMIYDWRGTTADNLVDLVNIDQVDIDGNTVLHIAALNGLLPCIERLVLRGADLSIQNFEQLTCSEMADRGGHFALGTVLELGKIFYPTDEVKEASQFFMKFTTDLPDPKLVPDCSSISLPALIDFMNEAIKTASEELGEPAARAEVLLNLYGWNFRALKRDFKLNSPQTLAMAHIRQRVETVRETKQKPDINIGIPVEEIYFDPCYANVPNFTIYVDGKKKVFTFQEYDGKVGVFPIDFDPSFKYLDSNHTFSETSHVKPKKTDPCPMCGKMMFEATSIQHFLAGTLVEPLLREMHCSSGHKFCFSCWSDFAQSQLKRENGRGCLPCPAVGCGEILDLQWAPVILKKADMVNRLIAQRQKHVVEALALRWCPVPNCGLLVRVPETPEGMENLDMAQKPPRVAICAHGHAFCCDCGRDAHTPCTCNQAGNWVMMLRDELESMSPNDERHPLTIVSRYPQSRKCPKCPTGSVNKTVGCNIVNCNNCHAQLCYICLEEWSHHGISTNGVIYCNRFGGRLHANQLRLGDSSHGGVMEEKQDDSGSPHQLQRSQRMARFVFYAHRFKAHEESWKLESNVRHVTIERIHEALRLSHEGELRWLHGGSVPNPYAEKELEMGTENLLKKFEEKEVGVDNFFFKSYPAVDFIVDAFDELERDRLFLRWTYPFVFLEFDEKPASQPVSPPAKLGGSLAASLQGQRGLSEVRQEFLSLQAALEFFTETLSSLIGRTRLRVSKQEIENATRHARAKRIELETFLINYFLTRRPEIVVEPHASASSSLTSRSSIKEPKETEPVQIVVSTMPPPSTGDFDISDDDDEEPIPEPPAPLPPVEQSNRTFTRIDTVAQQTITQISTEQTERQEFQRETMFRAGSFLVHHEDEHSMHRIQAQRIQVPTRFVAPPPPPPPPPPPQPIIEQRLIGAKKDPDQEALEHAILISKQEEEFGVNMYDALLDEDEPVVEEYMAQGFTREEAILIIFEERFGKVSIYQASRITPAMPTLHRVEGIPQDVSPEDEPEIEYLMTKGYTREQAIEVMFAQRKKAEERRLEELRRQERERERQERERERQERERQVEYERRYGMSTHRSAVSVTHSGSDSRAGSFSQAVGLDDHYYNTGVDSYGSAPARGTFSQSNSRRGSFEPEAAGATSMYRRESTQNVGNYTTTVTTTTTTRGMTFGPESEEAELLNLLQLGYTEEQARAVLLAQRTGGAVAAPAITVTRAESEEEGVHVYGEEDYLEDNAEVVYLMSKGYTREQAIQVAESNQRTRVTNNSNSGRNLNAHEREIQHLIEAGYTREQATQQVLQQMSSTPTSANTRGSSYNVHASSSMYQSSSSVSPPSNPQRSSVYRASTLMDQYSPTPTTSVADDGTNARRSAYASSTGGARTGSYYGSTTGSTRDFVTETGSTSHYESTVSGDYPQPPPPRGFRPQSAEEEEMERVLLISQQEAEFGVNMYECLTPADGPEVEQMIAMGYTEFEALKWIFDRRFRHNVQAQTQPAGPPQLTQQQLLLQQQQQQEQRQLQQQQLLLQQQQAQQEAQQQLLMQQQQQQAQQQQLLFQQQQQQQQQQQMFLRQQQQQQFEQQAAYMTGASGPMYDSYYDPSGQTVQVDETTDGSFYQPGQHRRVTTTTYYTTAPGDASPHLEHRGSMYDMGDERHSGNGHHHHHSSGHHHHSSSSVTGRQSLGGHSSNGHHSHSSHRMSTPGAPAGKKKVFRGASLLGMTTHIDTGAEAEGVNSTYLHRLEKAGFKRSDCIRALKHAGGNVDEAAILLATWQSDD